MPSWRIPLLAFQLATIAAATWWTTGSAASSEIWFASILAIAIHGQLVEPHYTRAPETLANSIVGLVFWYGTAKTITAPAWGALAVVLSGTIGISLIAFAFGRRQKTGGRARAGHVANQLCRVARARAIYSVTFGLSLLESQRGITEDLWQLSGAWFLVILSGEFNWQSLLIAATGKGHPALIHGMVGPSRIMLTAPAITGPGTAVRLHYGSVAASATVIARYRRTDDVWAELHVGDPEACEALVAAQAVSLSADPDGPRGYLGFVDAESTHERLVFSPVSDLEIGQVVRVASAAGTILYQVGGAQVREATVKGGAHLVVRASANQLGIYDARNERITRYGWVPAPGAPVLKYRNEGFAATDGDGDRLLLGHVIGTDVPVILDLSVLKEGHLAILGMTRMGKTTFARRLIGKLSNNQCVRVLDQTGEYRGKHGLPPCTDAADTQKGATVFEPAPGKPVPDEGLAHLKRLANRAYTEYENGTPLARFVLIDEAHQFVPEPALLGFGTPGRDSAIKFGMYVMQLRKYGISLAFISQRTAVVAKTAISQCENVIAFKSVDQTGLEYLATVLGGNARDLLPRLSQGEAIVSGPALSADTAVGVKIAEA